MKIAKMLLSAVFVLAALPALAANACYTPEQLQAEQLLRLHSELMVITVTCHQGSQGQDLAAAYGRFTKKNITVLHNAEQTMIAYYRAHEKGNPLDHLDRLRTVLGNEFGQKSADMSSQAYCDQYRDKVLQFDEAKAGDVDDEVHRMQISEHAYAKPCSAATTIAGKK